VDIAATPLRKHLIAGRAPSTKSSVMVGGLLDLESAQAETA